MSTITVRKADERDMHILLTLRREMLANENADELFRFDEKFMRATEDFFRGGDQSTYLSFDGTLPVACATVCYIKTLPTFANPTGISAQIMNIYTKKEYRAGSASRKVMTAVLAEARERGVSQIQLDSADNARPLHR